MRTGSCALLLPGPTAAYGQSGENRPGKTGIAIEIVLGADTVLATLDGTHAVRDLLSLLPLAVTLEDYAATEKIARLPRKLSIRDTPEGHEPRAGDFTYYAPWGNLALFYRDFRYSPGLVKLGTIVSGRDALMKVTSAQVTIALSRRP